MNTVRFSVILVDPPWKYRNWSDKKHGAAIAHYQTMDLPELQAIPVGEWAATSSVLMLWTTWPKLDQGMRLIEAWGFAYVTGIPWIKVVPSSGEIRRGVGFWTMSASEMLLIARRGEPKRKDINGGKDKPIGLFVDEDGQRVFYAPIRRHSAKPLEVHGWVEETLDGPYLELFARQERSGWTCYGDDLGWHLGDGGVVRIVRARGLPGDQCSA